MDLLLLFLLRDGIRWEMSLKLSRLASYLASPFSLLVCLFL